MKLFTICKTFVCIMGIKIAARSIKRILLVEVKLECISKVAEKLFHPTTKNYRCFKSTGIYEARILSMPKYFVVCIREV